ncbi:uncharacterized protein N7483_001556 [Penicillium malachiteum]|uniref:uncharacterized protein n=1 Tax=Penicillium malachiteum TaxID=1324776 RepID=UPI002548911F|nr:uncharacterized protein N7483_001556 [Penicillium malachiteum]KAJ5736431.1 hypothetical protein N7483_001556 [Penicillium malachiteum]
MSESAPSRNILIVGAGLGGLCASLALKRKGHTVTVIDSVSEFVEAGAGIRIPPNSCRLLLRWGVDLNGIKKTISTGYNFVRWEDGSTIARLPFLNNEETHGAPYYLVHRADLHAVLLKAALDAGVTVHKNQRVVDYDFSIPAAITAEGTSWTAELLICADGVKSISRPLLTGQPDKPRDTGDVAYRIVIRGEELLKDPELADLINKPVTTSWCGPDAHVVGYPIRDGELYNVVVCATSQGETTDEVWVVEGNNEELCERFSTWHSQFYKLCQLAPSFQKWRLCDLPILSTWIHPSKKAILLGDSAHVMLPYLAQGAAQACEDAGTLSQVLSRYTDLSEALKQYESLRRPRASVIQSMTRQHQYILHIEDGDEQVQRDQVMKQDAPFNPVFWGFTERRHWLFSHDAEDLEIRKGGGWESPAIH